MISFLISFCIFIYFKFLYVCFRVCWNSNFRNKLMEITLWQNIIFWTVLSHLKFIIYMNFFYIVLLLLLLLLLFYFYDLIIMQQILWTQCIEILLDILLPLLLILFHLNSYFLYCALFHFALIFIYGSFNRFFDDYGKWD